MLTVIGKVNDIQVHFKERNTPVDFIILESTSQGNIVLGRTFLKAMRCFIDVKKGHILVCGKVKGKYLFPKREKEEFIEEVFAYFDDPYDGSIDEI